MTLSEIYQTIREFLDNLYEKYGERIVFLEVYDGQIIVHFKEEGADNAD